MRKVIGKYACVIFLVLLSGIKTFSQKKFQFSEKAIDLMSRVDQLSPEETFWLAGFGYDGTDKGADYDTKNFEGFLKELEKKVKKNPGRKDAERIVKRLQNEHFIKYSRTANLGWSLSLGYYSSYCAALIYAETFRHFNIPFEINDSVKMLTIVAFPGNDPLYVNCIPAYNNEPALYGDFCVDVGRKLHQYNQVPDTGKHRTYWQKFDIHYPVYHIKSNKEVLAMIFCRIGQSYTDAYDDNHGLQLFEKAWEWDQRHKYWFWLFKQLEWMGLNHTLKIEGYARMANLSESAKMMEYLKGSAEEFVSYKKPLLSWLDSAYVNCQGFSSDSMKKYFFSHLYLAQARKIDDFRASLGYYSRARDLHALDKSGAEDFAAATANYAQHDLGYSVMYHFMDSMSTKYPEFSQFQFFKRILRRSLLNYATYFFIDYRPAEGEKWLKKYYDIWDKHNVHEMEMADIYNVYLCGVWRYSADGNCARAKQFLAEGRSRHVSYNFKDAEKKLSVFCGK